MTARGAEESFTEYVARIAVEYGATAEQAACMARLIREKLGGKYVYIKKAPRNARQRGRAARDA